MRRWLRYVSFVLEVLGICGYGGCVITEIYCSGVSGVGCVGLLCGGVDGSVCSVSVACGGGFLRRGWGW